MTLSFLDEIYREIFAGDIRYLVYSSKGIAAIIIVVTLLKRVSISFTSTGKMISDKKDGLNAYELLRMLFMLFLALAADQVISGLDHILGLINTEASTIMDIDEQSIFYVSEYDLKKPVGEGAVATITYYFQIIIEKLSFFHGNVLAKPVELFGAMIEMIIFPIFLTIRYFFLGLLKIFAPLMFALSIYDKLRDYFYNILKLYARYALVIIPFMFVNVFANAVFQGVMDFATGNAVGVAVVTLAQGPIKLAGIIMIIVIKITLFKKCITFMEKLIT